MTVCYGIKEHDEIKGNTFHYILFSRILLYLDVQIEL